LVNVARQIMRGGGRSLSDDGLFGSCCVVNGQVALRATDHLISW